MTKFKELFAVAVSIVLTISTQSSVAFAGTHFSSGIFEGLMLAIDTQGNMKGSYREEQGEGVTKTCSFLLVGKATSNKIKVTTWSDRVLPGELKAVTDGVELKIRNGREHLGCGLVLLPQISDGMALDLVKKTKWRDLRKVSVKRSFLYSEPLSSKKRKGYLVSGDIVGVVSAKDNWLQIEYVGKKTIAAWIPLSDTVPLEPPK